MGLLKSFFAVPLVILGICVLIQYYWDFQNDQQLVEIAKWADEGKIKLDKNIAAEKFTVRYEQQEWDALVQKLRLTRYFDQLEGVKTFDYGFPVDYAKELVGYWKNTFNWRKQVEILNKYQNYKIKFGDITVHFIRVNNENAIRNRVRVPILLLNGWPSTYFEFYSAVEFLLKQYDTDERYLDIVVPSIPGFTYSTPLNKAIDLVDISNSYDALMRHLFGEKVRYFIHGEDWGGALATLLPKLYPARVGGVHVSMVSPTASLSKPALLTALTTHLFPSFMLTEEEKASNMTFSLTKRFFAAIAKTGYFHLQATKPDTLGFSFADSPVGLMTYILEKFAFGSFGPGVLGTKDGLLHKFSRDDLLSIVTLYWTTNSMPSSMRIYKNFINQLSSDGPRKEILSLRTPVSVPFAVSSFPYEIDHTPHAVLKKVFGNLKQYTVGKTGGHFAAFQETKITCDDFMQFVNSILSKP